MGTPKLEGSKEVAFLQEATMELKFKDEKDFAK
jgi:hypothetical protein